MAEVILQIGCGEIYFPPNIPPRLIQGKSYPANRMGTIVNMIKEEGYKNVIPFCKLHSNTFGRETQGKIYTLSDSKNYFYTYNPKTRKSNIYKLETINSSRPWTIIYDTKHGEHIHYFEVSENYIIIDKELNYGKFI